MSFEASVLTSRSMSLPSAATTTTCYPRLHLIQTLAPMSLLDLSAQSKHVVPPLALEHWHALHNEHSVSMDIEPYLHGLHSEHFV